MRFTQSLILGLSLAVVSGCSHCDQCRVRVPVLQRFSGFNTGQGIFSRQRQCSDGILTSNPSVHFASPSDCGCDTTPLDSNEYQTVVEENSNEEYIVTESDSTNSTPDTPEVPEPPSLQLQDKDIDGSLQTPDVKAPELKGTIEKIKPADSNTGYYVPKKSYKPNLNPVIPYVAEAPFHQDVNTNLNNANLNNSFAGSDIEKPTEPQLFVAPAKPSLELSSVETPKPTESLQLEPTPIDSEAIDSEAIEHNAQPEIASQSEFSVAPPKRIKAMQISSSKVIAPPERVQPKILDAVRPVPYAVIQENQTEPVEIQREMLPAKSEINYSPAIDKSQDINVLSAPVVLRAVPVDNHILNDRRRVADARAVDAYGFPSAGRVEFKSLPSLDGESKDQPPVYYSTDQTPFEMPPLDQRIPDPHDSDSHTTIQALPSIEDGDTFTTATSYQVPMDGDASVLSEQSNAIDCGLMDNQMSILEMNQTDDAEQPAANPSASLLRILPPARVDSEVYYQPKSKDNLFRLGAFESDSNSKNAQLKTDQQLRILRMRATTPLDQHAVVPPQVSIKSVVNPIFVRHRHPEAQAAIDAEANKLRMKSRPIFDTERLEASIRGLETEAGDNGQGQRTIDR